MAEILQNVVYFYNVVVISDVMRGFTHDVILNV